MVGELMHLLSDPALFTYLAALCEPATKQPQFNALIRILYQALVHAVVSHLALRWVIGRDSTLPGVMFAVEPRPTPAIEEHPVLRVPRCPACSS